MDLSDATPCFRTEPVMPRPTPAQLASGTATVVFATIAMLLLSNARSGPGVIVIAVVGLTLGTLVAVTAPAQRQASRSRGRQDRVTPTIVPSSSAEPRLREHSLH